MTSTDSNGVPLTRRQIREQAAAAAAAAASAGGQSTGRPEQAPAAPEQRRAPQAQQPAQRPRQTAQPAVVRQPTAQQPDHGSAQRRSTPPPRQPAATQPPATQRSASQVPPTLASQPSRVGHSRIQQSSRPATPEPSAGGPGISRRALREQTGVQRPVVVPPIQSNAIRTVDETGELSGLRDLGTGRSPHAAPSSRPVADGGREPATSQPPIQRQPVQRQPPQRVPAQRQPDQPMAPGAAPVQPAATQPAPVRRQSLQGLPTRQPGETGPLREQGQGPMPGMLGPDTARRPWPTVAPAPGAATGAAAAFRTPQVVRSSGPAPATPDLSISRPGVAGQGGSGPAADAFHQRISAPVDEPATRKGVEDDVFDELPPWDAITAAPAAGAPSRAFPPLAARADDELDDLDDDYDDDDEDDDENDHKYTWLHYLILVAVAFVLGLIIWKVGLEGRGAAAPPDSTSDASIALQSERAPDSYL